MGAPKPCLGYRSRTEAVLALRKAGWSTAAIAERLGVSIKSIYSLESSSRRHQDRGTPARPPATTRNALLLPQKLINALAPHAERRGLRPTELAFFILETVVDDGMINAVLDDLGDDLGEDAAA
jgi:transposase